MKTVARAFTTAALLLSVVQILPAQRPQTRHGFWLNYSAGGARIGCDGCRTIHGISSNLTIGGTIGKQWLLAGSIQASASDEAFSDLTLGIIGVSARYYPIASAGGAFVTGTVGFANTSRSVSWGVASSNGSGASLGVGYDVRFARNVSHTPFANLMSLGFDGGSNTVRQFGLGITVH